MYTALVSIKKPMDDSKEFYRCFYNCYNMLQVSDFVLRECYSNCKNKDNLIKEITELCNGEEYKRASVYTIGAGLLLKGLNQRAKEVRGFENIFIDELKRQNEDPIEWYLKVNEFILLYAYTDQGLKSFLWDEGENKEFRENQLMRLVCDKLEKDSHKKNFIREIELLSNSIIRDEDTLRKLWDYFTMFRNLLMHSGGFITENFVNRLQNLKKSIDKKINSVDICLDMIWGKNEDLDEECVLKFSLEPGKLFVIDENFINLFRNYVLILLESLDKFYKKS